MKKWILVGLFLVSFSLARGQDLAEMISEKVCECIDTIENMDSLDAKISRCVPKTMEQMLINESDPDDDYPMTDESIREMIDAVMKYLPQCDRIRNFILGDKERKYYRISGSDAANRFYMAASTASEEGNYQEAVKQYLKAIKADPEWVYPYDDLGLTYRKMGEYQKAVRYYGKSLEIYPEGKFALQNLAVAYTYLEDYDQALKNYNRLISLYPDNPEGYFGKALVFYTVREYEKALDYVFQAHVIYSEMESDYLKDSESIIRLLYKELKKQDKQDFFEEKAKNYGINFNYEDE